MRPLSLASVGKAFQAELARQKLLLSQASQYELRTGRGPRPLKPKELALIAELAYLKVFLSWERFLEQSFLRYLCGCKDKRIKMRCFVVFPNLEHASMLVTPEGRRYAEWADASTVRERAKRFFKNGEPYWSALGQVMQRLDEMRIIRNCIAHQSSHASTRFEGIVRQAIGTVPRGITPGDFLLRIATGPNTYFASYTETLAITTARIVT
jgi:hypothetical protein